MIREQVPESYRVSPPDPFTPGCPSDPPAPRRVAEIPGTLQIAAGGISRTRPASHDHASASPLLRPSSSPSRIRPHETAPHLPIADPRRLWTDSGIFPGRKGNREGTVGIGRSGRPPNLPAWGWPTCGDAPVPPGVRAGHSPFRTSTHPYSLGSRRFGVDRIFRNQHNAALKSRGSPAERVTS